MKDVKWLLLVVFILSIGLSHANTEWMWAHLYPDPSPAEASTVCDSNDYSYTSYQISANTNGRSAKMVKTSIYGDTEWVSDLCYPNLELSIIPYRMAIDHNDNIYIFGLNSGRLCLVKMDTDGEVIWFRQTTVTVDMSHTSIYDITVTPDGCPVIGFENFQGGLNLWGVSSTGRHIIKFDALGNVTNRVYPWISSGANLNTKAAGITCDQSGNLYVSRRLPISGGYNGYRIYIDKYSNSLELLDSTTLFEFTYTQGYPVIFNSAIKITTNSSIIVSGYVDRAYNVGGLSFPSGGWFTACLNPDFSFQWVVPYGGENLELDPLGNICLGYSINNVTRVSKLDPQGVLTDTKVVTSSIGNSRRSSFAVDSNGDCLISVPYIGGLIQGDGLEIHIDDYGYGLFLAKLGVPFGELTLDATVLNLGVSSVGYESDAQPVSIRNIGTGELTIGNVGFANYPDIWQFNIDAGSELPISIAVNDSISASVSFIPTEAIAYQDTMFIYYGESNNQVKRIRLSGQGVYAIPGTVQNVSVSLSGADALIEWDPTVSTIHNTPINVDYYFVYGSVVPDPDSTQSIFLGYSTNASFIHLGVGLPGSNHQPPREFFYSVTAVICNPSRNIPISLDELVGMSMEEVSRVLFH